MTETFEDNDANGKMPFPYKLFQMLKDADDKGFRHIVSWNSNGKSFKVHDSIAFTKYIVPKYFKQTRYKSFQRQLCLYGFDRVLTGHQKGSRFHKNFVRGNFKLCNEIKYIGIKSKAFEQLQTEAANKQSQKQAPETKKAAANSISEAAETVVSNDDSFRSKPYTMHIKNPDSFNNEYSVEKMRAVVSPTMSPVASDTNLIGTCAQSSDPATLLELQALDDLGLFEGMAFHLIDPFLPPEDEKFPTWTQTPSEPTVKSVAPTRRQVSMGDFEMTTTTSPNHKNLVEAWQKGFEYALSMPRDSNWSMLHDEIEI